MLTLRLTLTCLIAILGAPALAQTVTATLRGLARVGDVAVLEAAFAAGQAAFMAGQASADDIRQMVSALTVTDPTIRATVADWHATMPESPYVSVIMAFNAYRDGFSVRGEASRAETYPDALTASARLHDAGMTFALQAYAADPDFVPASDAIFRLQTTTRNIDPLTFDDIVARVMSETPNRGSLSRAIDQTRPQWGGAGAGDVGRLCDLYADRVQDVADYDAVTCFIDNVYFYRYPPDVLEFASYLLQDTDNPILDHVRWAQPMTSDAATELRVRNYLLEPTNMDVELARLYDGNFSHIMGLAPLTPLVGARNMADTRRELRDAPYNPDLLTRILDAESYNPIGDRPYSSAERFGFARDLAIAAPYDATSWTQLSQSLHGLRYRNPLDQTEDAVLINAVVFSNDGSGLLWNLTTGKLSVAEDLVEMETPLAVQAEVAICPMLRAERLLLASCEDPGLYDWICDMFPEKAAEIAAISAPAIAAGLCEWERTAPIGDIRYTPVPVDLMALLPPD